VQYVPPDGFFCIQIVQNSISAGAPPWTPLGELTTLLQTTLLAGDGDVPSQFPILLQRVAVDAEGVDTWCLLYKQFLTIGDFK